MNRAVEKCDVCGLPGAKTNCTQCDGSCHEGCVDSGGICFVCCDVAVGPPQREADLEDAFTMAGCGLLDEL